MSDRAADIATFLRSAGWGGARHIPLAGDLSSRHYTRLVKGDTTAVLMDADTPMDPFLTMTRWLSENRFSAPDVYAEQADDGLILLEDFGDTSITRHCEREENIAQIDPICVELLLALRAGPAPVLPTPDAATLVDWTRLADQHYPGIDPDGLAPFREVLRESLKDSLQTPPTLSLRDFHADNMMWLPARTGTSRLGLLDYQDAFLTHPCYDLVSYLTDARTAVSTSRRSEVLNHYLTLSGDDPVAFRAAFAAMSAQRNLRILGIFTKSAAAGKPHHLPKLPRVHAYFTEALEHDMFKDIRDATRAAIPDPSTIQGALT